MYGEHSVSVGRPWTAVPARVYFQLTDDYDRAKAGSKSGISKEIGALATPPPEPQGDRLDFARGRSPRTRIMDV
jgi:hypothetical protein